MIAAPAVARPPHSSGRRLREAAPAYRTASRAVRSGGEVLLAEHELTALRLLGRVPEAVLPWPLLRPGRAGQGPEPDIREATFLMRSGVVRSGAVEVHLRASDFVRHGHSTDPAYAAVVLHLVWTDDRPAPEGQAGLDAALADGWRSTDLPGGGRAVTVAVGPALRHDPERLRALVQRGPSGGEPCMVAAAERGAEATTTQVRQEGQRRLAERVWQAERLVDACGWDAAWAELLERALHSSAGRCHETPTQRAALAARVTAHLGADVPAGLARLAAAGPPRAVIEALRGPLHGDEALGQSRAAEVGWNAALPLLAALAAAYDDVALARQVAALVAAWPAPRPYGRTRALGALLGKPASGAGALYAQGLLHVQDVWCERGGCGVCPLSRPGDDSGA